MTWIKKLYYEQYKNFRIILRNPSSLALLILGPLFLIILIGYAYSGEDASGIKIGIISPDYAFLEPALSNFSAFAQTVFYSSSEECIRDMKVQSAHICLEFRGAFSFKEGIPERASIIYYFDNTRKSLSNKIVEVISAFFGSQAEKISIESAETVFSNVQNFVAFIGARNQDLALLVNESLNLREELVERREKLIAFREEFLPIYMQLKDIQSLINNASLSLEESFTLAMNRTDAMLNSTYKLEAFLSHYEDTGKYFIYLSNETYLVSYDIGILDSIQDYYNLSDLNYSVNGSILYAMLNETTNISAIIPNDYDILTLISAPASQLLRNAKESYLGLRDASSSFYHQAVEQKNRFNHAVGMLDEVMFLLESDINSTEEYIWKIDRGVEKIKIIQEEMESSMGLLSDLEPEMADQLIRPILQNYQPILPGVKNIRLAFPALLAMITVFISILFANIIALAEVNSRAFYRNIISPTGKYIFVSGLCITALLIVLFQVSVLLFVGQVSLKIGLIQGIGPIYLIVFLLSFFFISLGMSLAFFLKNVQTSILTTTFVALGFFLFSDGIAPLETMPAGAAVIASRNPFVISALAFKRIIVFGARVDGIANEIFILSIYLFAALILLTISYLKRLGEFK